MPKSDLLVRPPLMNAAGSLGFVPNRRSGRDWKRFGAFFTNPISLGPRTPSHGCRYMPFPGGFLLHTGYPNPGLQAALRRYAPAWARSSLPVVVHLLAQEPGELARIVRRLEGVEGVMGVEVGLPPGVDASLARQLVQAALGEMILIVRLPFEQAVDLGVLAVQAGAAAVSLGAPRGALPGPDGKPVEGRLYGPAVFPQALHLTRQLAGLGLPVIAGGGVYSGQDARVLLEAGAVGVQLDASLWLEHPTYSLDAR